MRASTAMTASNSIRSITLSCWSGRPERSSWPGQSSSGRSAGRQSTGSTWRRCGGRVHGRLRRRRATREFVRILQLHARYAPDVLKAALERALALGCWSADSVEQLARQALQSALPPTAINLAASPALTHLADVVIPLPDLQRYALLLAEVQA